LATYTVHEPPAPNADRIDRATELEFVKDGFSWLTLICPPLGFLAKGLWLLAIVYVFAAGLLAYALEKLKVDQQWAGLLFLAINVYLGFEISSLKRWMLRQKGWRTLGVVNGKNIAECERRFFEGWLPSQPIIAGDGAGGANRMSGEPHRAFRFWPFGRTS
jgi:hypothetical protein